MRSDVKCKLIDYIGMHQNGTAPHSIRERRAHSTFIHLVRVGCCCRAEVIWRRKGEELTGLRLYRRPPNSCLWRVSNLRPLAELTEHHRSVSGEVSTSRFTRLGVRFTVRMPLPTLQRTLLGAVFGHGCLFSKGLSHAPRKNCC